MTPLETAARVAVRGSGERKRLGDGMFTPVRPLEFRDPWSGSVQQLHPGRDRVSADWWGYKRQPELFRVANRGDEVTAARHRQTLERTAQAIRRQLGRTETTKASAPAFRLPRSNPGKTWRLP